MDIEREILRILCGYRYFTAYDANKKKLNLYTTRITPLDRNNAFLYYDTKVDEYVDRGLMTEEQLLCQYAKDNIWTENDDRYVDRLRQNIEQLKKERSECKFKTLTANRLTHRINILQDSLHEKLIYKYELLQMCAEHTARIDMLHSLAVRKIHSVSNKRPLWQNTEDILNETDVTLLNYVYENILNTLSVKDMRLIARSSQWRTRWNCTKDKAMGIFGVPCSQLDIEQEQLIYWSQFYDSVYNAYNKPSDDVINDDDKLDDWLISESNKEKTKSDDIPVSDKIKKHQEIFIFAETKEDADKIYQMNPDGVRKSIGKKFNKLTGKVEKDAKVRFGKEYK